jgi:tetratricopeptide (TPR) repeat protein
MAEQLTAQLLVLKAEGNIAFKARDYAKAIEIYSRAVKLLPDLDDDDDESLHRLTPELLRHAAIILCNRSAAYMGEKKAVAALADAQLAADYDSTNWKAHFRAGLAFMHMEPRLERSEKAIASFEATLLCTSLPSTERDNVARALEAAQYRLREGRDSLDLPSMEQCAIS